MLQKGCDFMTFIPREKLSRKARRKLDNQRRQFWPVCPASKIFDDKKTYSRKRKSRDYLSDWYCGIFYYIYNLPLLC